MSLCKRGYHPNDFNQALLTHARMKDLKKCSPKAKGIPLSSCRAKKASMTLEAAVVFPLVAGFLVMLLFFFRCQQVQTQMQISMAYAGRKTATVAAGENSNAVLLAAAYGFWVDSQSDNPIISEWVSGGIGGVNFSESDASEDEVKLIAKYKIRFPVDFFGQGGFAVEQTQVSKKWTGDQDASSSEDDPYVYITEDGEAYHSTTSCSYLDLTIHSQLLSGLEDQRNVDGHKYYPCRYCAKGLVGNETVYITSYGECYHANLQCPGLKRTIFMVRLSEVGDRHACSKCYGT